MFVMLCARLNICFVVWVVIRYLFNPRPKNLANVKGYTQVS